jgi:hypothetical protein
LCCPVDEVVRIEPMYASGGNPVAGDAVLDHEIPKIVKCLDLKL